MDKIVDIKSFLGVIFFLVMPCFAVWGEEEELWDIETAELEEVEVGAFAGNTKMEKVNHVEQIGTEKLVRAACCNLGESFTFNPSVDVSYSDAATGAKQIKLLGLSGKYVQMLTENVPNLRGAAIPYGLSYVPGPWMQSIQVSKGASSVKNGYESTTGQINIEYKKPQGEEEFNGNLFFNSHLKYEANADGNIHLNDRLSTNLLLHFEDQRMKHDGNGDGFMDSPCQRQYNLMHRWSYLAKRWKSQILFHVLRDERNSGMVESDDLTVPLYRVGVTTNRYLFQWKNAYIVDYQKNTSVALMLHGSWHDADNDFGHSFYDVTQKNGYAQLMYESDLTDAHNLAAGLSLNHDLYDEASSLFLNRQELDRETSSGGYLQYTYKLKKKLTAMLGGRWDYSSRYGGFFTPRVHLRYSPTDKLTLRTSAGKGRRTPHALAEHSQMMASGRTFYFAERLKQEEAWNVGVSAHLMLPVHKRTLEVNAEYYYTDFQNVLVVNVDGARGAHTVSFENLDGSSYSHTVQVDATYPFAGRWEVMVAGRLNDVRTTYDGELRIQPFSPRMKGLLTLSYKTKLDIWRFDVTGQLNGKGKRYDQTDYPTYLQLQAQVSREFRYFTLYAGGENLTAYRMDEPIQHAENPWSEAFDATQVWGPTHGAMAYVGMRFHLKKKK